jgi:hypothetical protein
MAETPEPATTLAAPARRGRRGGSTGMSAVTVDIMIMITTISMSPAAHSAEVRTALAMARAAAAAALENAGCSPFQALLKAAKKASEVPPTNWQIQRPPCQCLPQSRWHCLPMYSASHGGPAHSVAGCQCQWPPRTSESTFKVPGPQLERTN